MKSAYSIAIIVLSLFFLAFIYSYYGAAGLEIIIALPSAIVFIIFGGIIAGLAINRLSSKKEKRVGLALSLIIIFIVVSSAHPTDGEIKPSAYFFQYLTAKITRGSIDYINIFDEEKSRKPFKQIAISRYKEHLPDRAFIVHYYQSEKTEWKNRVRIAFEEKDKKWTVINLSNTDLMANFIKAGTNEDGSELFNISINKIQFSEKYYPGISDGDSRFISQDGKWKKGEPRIIIFEWKK